MNLQQRLACLTVCCLLLAGCDYESLEPSIKNTGPFGRIKQSELLAPFAGHWKCEVGKTLEAFRGNGSSEQEIKYYRSLLQNDPERELHPDLQIEGDLALYTDIVPSEYRFYSMHKHDPWVCGKAWHHEDRYDPGDMTKCYVRLKMEDDLLYLDVRMKDGWPEPDDPELTSAMPVEGGSPQSCQADNPPGEDWNEWTTFVFSRVQ